MSFPLGVFLLLIAIGVYYGISGYRSLNLTLIAGSALVGLAGLAGAIISVV